jgi:pre-rRNA-processing protein IPI1
VTASTSRFESQRREALVRLTSRCVAVPPDTNEAMQLLDALPPLISDKDGALRSQLLKLFRTIPAPSLKQQRVEKLINFVRAGMTDISSHVRVDSLQFLDWLLDTQEDLVLTCPGGWPKTLRTFIITLGWSVFFVGTTTSDDKGWTSAPRTTFGAEKSGQSYIKQITSLTRFIKAGLRTPEPTSVDSQSYWSNLWRLPRSSYPYAHLQLHLQDEYSRHYVDDDMRRQFFRERMMNGMLKATDEARKEGGAAGRAAAVLEKTIQDGMGGYISGDGKDGDI